MQTLQSCLPPNASSLTPSKASAPTVTEIPLAPTAARTLWVRMAEIYGHRWTSAYGDNPNEGAALTWAKGLAGISAKQVGDGLRACVSSSDPWPPTLPEFRGMCLSIPTLAAVKVEQSQDGLRSPFARLVWSYLDGYAMRRASSDQCDRMIREAYGLAREHVMRGGELPPEPAGEITQEERRIVVASREVAAKAIADGMALLHRRVAATEQAEQTAAQGIDKSAVEAELHAHYSAQKGAKA